MDQTGSSHYVLSENQESGKMGIPSPEILLEPSQRLPDAYGEDRLVIMARDPLCFFVYWEVTPERLKTLREQSGTDHFAKAQAVLRVFDVTDAPGPGQPAAHFFDVGISLDAGKWYIRVPTPGRVYSVELGFVFLDGQFRSLLHSNQVALPAGRVSELTDSRWMAVSVTDWNKLMEISGSEHIGKGSLEISKMMAQRWEFLKSVFSGSWATPPSSAFFSSSSPAAPVEKKP